MEAKKETDVTGPYAARKLTLAENAILTVKVLATMGLIGAALWGINHLTAAAG